MNALVFDCPYLKGDVELTDERKIHITLQHPDLLPEFSMQLEQTLAAPHQIRRSLRMSSARMFYRWYDDVRKGKYIVVVVVSESTPVVRHWIITAYLTNRLANGEIEWQKI
ncbi:MAG: hypothetical protein H8E28_15270 [Anaerolineae bacterium]|nr:hypothetical protein [Anaerolineae bacterium]